MLDRFFAENIAYTAKQLHLNLFMLRYLACFLLFCSSTAGAASIERNPGESTAAFVQRLAPPGTTVTHKPIETTVWNFAAPVVLAFYEVPPAQDDGTGATLIRGFAFVPESASAYEKVEIDTYESEGGNPVVESVFFASTGKTPEKKLAVIVSWEQNHATVSGTLYETFIYGAPTAPVPQKLVYLRSLSEKFTGCECAGSDGPPSKAKYKTAAAVKAALLKM